MEFFPFRPVRKHNDVARKACAVAVPWTQTQKDKEDREKAEKGDIHCFAVMKTAKQ
jgi:hypothetical protein